MNQLGEGDAVRVFKALADSVRFSIVQKLAREGCAVSACDIVACSSVQKLSQPTMSHHFAKLVEAGVVVGEKRGTQKVYTLNQQLLSTVGVDISKL